jgi:hypothetical protein
VSQINRHIHDVLLRGLGLGRAELRQSASSDIEVGSLGGPISPRPRTLPNLEPSSRFEGGAGLNFVPLVHSGSLSAAPNCPSGMGKPLPRRLG